LGLIKSCNRIFQEGRGGRCAEETLVAASDLFGLQLGHIHL
jgi:hypothetical protein